jgi:AbiV family abortive infection protein
MQSEVALRSAAANCYMNAQALYEEAGILYQEQRYPRASALAVIGAEEFGKAIVYVVAALLPDQRHLLPSTLDGHELKHRICDLAEAAQIVNKDGWDAAGCPSSPVGRLTDLFVPLAERGLASFLDKNEARQFYTELRTRHKELQREWSTFQTESKTDWSLASREPDLKNAALYVDLDPTGKVLSPMDRVDDRCARISILGLGWFLDEYAKLSAVISDNSEWQKFADEVRRRHTVKA